MISIWFSFLFSMPISHSSSWAGFPCISFFSITRVFIERCAGCCTCRAPETDRSRSCFIAERQGAGVAYFPAQEWDWGKAFGVRTGQLPCRGLVCYTRSHQCPCQQFPPDSLMGWVQESVLWSDCVLSEGCSCWRWGGIFLSVMPRVPLTQFTMYCVIIKMYVPDIDFLVIEGVFHLPPFKNCHFLTTKGDFL